MVSRGSLKAFFFFFPLNCTDPVFSPHPKDSPIPMGTGTVPGLCRLPPQTWAWSLLCRAGLAYMDTGCAAICPKSQKQIGIGELFATTNRCKSTRSWLSLGPVLRARPEWGVSPHPLCLPISPASPPCPAPTSPPIPAPWGDG